MKKFIKDLIWWFSSCRKCRQKEDKGLVACSCTKGLFVKKNTRRRKENAEKRT